MKLNRKILFITISILTVSMLISSTVLIANFRRNYTEALLTASYGLGQNLNSVVVELLSLGLPLETFTGMDRKCRQLMENNPHISYVGITDLTGKVLYNADPGLVGKVFTDAVMKKSVASTVPITQLYHRFDGIDYYDVTIPIRDSSQKGLGVIRIGFPVSVVNSKVMSALSQVFVNFALSFIAIAILINYFMSRYVSRPVISISEHAKKIAGGDYDVKLEVVADDEVSLLADSINQMSCQVKQKTSDLEAVNTRLESTLAEQIRAERERLELERQLLHSQKLESLGVLAGGIAHDFNNLLTAIVGNLDLALIRLDPSSPVIPGIERALKACQKASDLSRQMLAYSGKGVFQLTEVDLNRMVKENSELFRTTVPKTITLDIDLAADLPLVTGDPGQIQQVVMNLITNASEAIGDAPGTVRLLTGVQECDETMVKLNRLPVTPAPGLYAYIEVSDSGCGMDHEAQQRIFEPFYTTKFTGRGLGMSAVLGIIKAHNGAILLDTEKGKGSRFKVFFPVSAVQPLARPDGGAAHAEAADRTGFGGTVLIVDDEPIVLEVCAEYLRSFGFDTACAADGEEALDLLRRRQDDIVLVILDLTMPNMDGVAAFREIKQIRPGLKVIVSSGHAPQTVAQSFLDLKPDAFVQKPYEMKVLKAAIAELLS